MPHVLAGALAALALAASAPVVDPPAPAAGGAHGASGRVALGSPGAALQELAEGALAPAPDKVIRRTRYYGTVTIDHRAHLARRTRCASCHGPGPVSKLELPPRVAHERCVGCHRQEARGPTGCKECHVVAPAAPPVQVAEGAAEAPAGPGAPALVASHEASPGGGPAPAPAARATPEAVPATLAAPTELADPSAFTQVLSAGYSLQGGSRDAGPGGLSVAFTARSERLVVLLSVDQGDGTVGLLGAGALLPLGASWRAMALGVGGIDARQRPELTVLPAVGVRVGVEWAARRLCLGAAVTGLADLGHGTSATGQPIGGLSVLATVSAGLVLGR